MPTYPPAVLPQPIKKDLREALDAFAYLLSTDDRTKGVTWILGDVGMGSPQETPFAYISQLNESVKWYTANGGTGGLPGGPTGLDDWIIPIVLSICVEPHQWVPPGPPQPPAGNAYSTIPNLPYQEQPGWQDSLAVVQAVKGVLRQNIVIGGSVATTNIVEAKPMLLSIADKTYRAARITIMAQQRRVRGT